MANKWYLWLIMFIALLLTACNASTNGSAMGGLSKPSSTKQVYVTAVTYHTKYETIVYPELHDLPSVRVQKRLNAFLENNAIYVPEKPFSKPGSFTYHSTYNVVFQQGNIMNIVYSSYFFATGAAHGMPAHVSLLFNLKTGQIYSPNDIFRSKSNDLQEISQLIKKEDTGKALDTFGQFTGVTSNDTMFLREGGLVVDFSPYEWASFAQGFLDYYVPFSSLMNVIDTNSPLWKAMHSTEGLSATNDRSEEMAKISSLGYSVSLYPEYQTSVITAKGDTLTGWVGNKQAANPMASGSYVFFFLNGKYLSTDTSRSHGYVNTLFPDGVGTIAVSYTYFSSAGDNIDFTILYHWNGSKLVVKGSFPPGYYTAQG